VNKKGDLRKSLLAKWTMKNTVGAKSKAPLTGREGFFSFKARAA
jgi:hypothetical protein